MKINKSKSVKPVVRTARRWTTEANLELHACFDSTDWSVFEAASSDLDEFNDIVALYTSFCEDVFAD